MRALGKIYYRNLEYLEISWNYSEISWNLYSYVSKNHWLSRPISRIPMTLLGFPKESKLYHKGLFFGLKEGSDRMGQLGE